MKTLKPRKARKPRIVKVALSAPLAEMVVREVGIERAGETLSSLLNVVVAMRLGPQYPDLLARYIKSVSPSQIINTELHD